MYGIAIHERVRRTITLSRDPFGIKPLYIATIGGRTGVRVGTAGPAGSRAGEARRYAPPRWKNCCSFIAAYLRLGAKIGGEPSWDPEFGVADFFVLVSVERLAARYARRFIGRAGSAPCAL